MRDRGDHDEAIEVIRMAVAAHGVRTCEALVDAVADALLKITPADILGWFGTCGYGTST